MVQASGDEAARSRNFPSWNQDLQRAWSEKLPQDAAGLVQKDRDVVAKLRCWAVEQMARVAVKGLESFDIVQTALILPVVIDRRVDRRQAVEVPRQKTRKGL